MSELLMNWLEGSKRLIKSHSNIHIPGNECSVIIFSTPRSGSTWLMELIWTQKGFKCINEPLNMRVDIVREYLGVNSWQELCEEEAKPKILNYFSSFSEGTYHFYDPNPFQKYYRPLTSRIVYKVLHGGELWINEIAKSCNARVICLIRHPIAVSISRQQLPRLDVFCSDLILQHFHGKIADITQKICQKGTFLEKAVLSWCIQNQLAMRQRADNWIFITYEQLTTDPIPVLNRLMDELELDQKERLLDRLSIPSAVKNQSDIYTQKLLSKKTDSSRELVEKWKKKVTKESEKELFKIIDAFEIDIYSYGSCYPNERYII